MKLITRSSSPKSRKKNLKFRSPKATTHASMSDLNSQRQFHTPLRFPMHRLVNLVYKIEESGFHTLLHAPPHIVLMGFSIITCATTCSKTFDNVVMMSSSYPCQQPRKPLHVSHSLRHCHVICDINFFTTQTRDLT